MCSQITEIKCKIPVTVCSQITYIKCLTDKFSPCPARGPPGSKFSLLPLVFSGLLPPHRLLSSLQAVQIYLLWSCCFSKILLPFPFILSHKFVLNTSNTAGILLPCFLKSHLCKLLIVPYSHLLFSMNCHIAEDILFSIPLQNLQDQILLLSSIFLFC